MAVYYKPQSPIQSGEDFIYPITTADQVKVDKDTRLNAVGVYLKNIDNSTDTTVYGNNATTLGGVAASDYALKTDTAPDSSKLGGKAPEYYIQPRNLLDNSDFRNPVNQRGATSYSGTTYTIDRWWIQTDTGTASIGNNGLTLATNDSTSCKIMQYVEKLDINKVYTFVIKDTSENVYLIHSVPNGRNEEKTSFGSMIVNTTNLNNENKSAFSISLDLGTTITLIWAALYEGSYTAETLPEYQPKGYAAELAECQRYFERLGGTFSEVLGNAVYAASGAASIIISIHYSPKRIKHPTIVMSDTSQYRVLLKDATNCNTYTANSLSAFGDINAESSFGQIKVAMTGNISQDSWLILQRSDGATAAYIDVSADL